MLVDLFCGQGGASVGYARAGFRVVGVDRFRVVDDRGRRVGLSRGPYPFPAHQGDALEVMDAFAEGRPVTFTDTTGAALVLRARDVDAWASSPPCQAHSITRHSHHVQHLDLIPDTRAFLTSTGSPYVIENVEGAPLRNPLRLCGSEFGLTATDTDGTPLRMERHRLFESDVFLMGAGGCRHNTRVSVAGAYGGGSSDRRYARDIRHGGYTPDKGVRAALLGIDWDMTMDGLSQSIPPAYTEHVGAQVYATL